MSVAEKIKIEKRNYSAKKMGLLTENPVYKPLDLVL